MLVLTSFWHHWNALKASQLIECLRESCEMSNQPFHSDHYNWCGSALRVITCSKLTIVTLDQTEICSKLTRKTPERGQLYGNWSWSKFSIFQTKYLVFRKQQLCLSFCMEFCISYYQIIKKSFHKTQLYINHVSHLNPLSASVALI